MFLWEGGGVEASSPSHLVHVRPRETDLFLLQEPHSPPPPTPRRLTRENENAFGTNITSPLLVQIPERSQQTDEVVRCPYLV